MLSLVKRLLKIKGLAFVIVGTTVFTAYAAPIIIDPVLF